MATKLKLAVFDVDGTIFRSSLTRRLFLHLVNEGVFPARARDEVEPYLRAWLNRRGTYDAYILKLVQTFIKYIKGVPQGKVRRISREVIAQEKSHVYQFTRDLVLELRRKGYFLVAISGSPFEIVRWYNRALKFSKTYGWVLETDARGRYTGKARYTYSIFDKEFLVKHVVKKYNLTLKGSIAVGDSKSDISMLKMVDRPIAFNPSAELYKVARKNGWEIVVERKDVVYKI